MPNELQKKSDTEQIEQNKNKVLQPGVKRIIGGGSGLLVLLLVFTFALPAGRIMFFTGGLLSIATLVIIALQAVIYSGQWKAMTEGLAIERAKIAPRVRVDDVKVVNFREGGRPAFIVVLTNDGATDAKDVSVHIRVRLRKGDMLALKWKTPHIETIPANQRKVYFLPWKTPLTKDYIDEVETGKVPMEVEVSFQVGDSPSRPLCYRYYPWPDGGRPEGIPEFLPCDFDTRLVTVVKSSSKKGEHDPTIEMRMDDATSEAEREADDKTDEENNN